LDTKDLRYFVAVYETRGFARASFRLNTVQSNVSARIKKFEQSLGVKLFVRGIRGIEPTAKGKKLYGYALEILATIEKMEAAMKADDAA
jgi:DNA-binding transcriptional LysR family regulator